MLLSKSNRERGVQGKSNIGKIKKSTLRSKFKNSPNSLDTGDTAALSPILDIASKYSLAARPMAGKAPQNVQLGQRTQQPQLSERLLPLTTTSITSKVAG